MQDKELEQLISSLSKLPGMGPRSARRAVLHLLSHKDDVMRPLAIRLNSVAERIQTCHNCGNFDVTNPCSICISDTRTDQKICVVTSVSDLWAIEKTEHFEGRYHVLGHLLSAIDGIGPEDLSLDQLKARLQEAGPEAEVILALPASVEGQSTAHYIRDELADLGVRVTGLARGIPMGGSIEYMDQGTIKAAMNSRR